MNTSIKNTLLAHVRAAKLSYGEISNGRYSIEFGMLGTYVIEFKFLVVDDQEYAEYGLYKNNELVFFIKHERYDAANSIMNYIDSL